AAPLPAQRRLPHVRRLLGRQGMGQLREGNEAALSGSPDRGFAAQPWHLSLRSRSPTNAATARAAVVEVLPDPRHHLRIQGTGLRDSPLPGHPRRQAPHHGDDLPQHRPGRRLGAGRPKRRLLPYFLGEAGLPDGHQYPRLRHDPLGRDLFPNHTNGRPFTQRWFRSSFRDEASGQRDCQPFESGQGMTNLRGMSLPLPPPLPGASSKPKRPRKRSLLIFALLALVGVEAAVVVLFISRLARRDSSRFRSQPVYADRHSSPVPAQSGRKTSAPKVPPKPAPKPTGPRAAPPQFTMAGGVFTNELAVELKPATAGAVIRYTLDGSEPEESSPVYSKPLVIAQTTVVRARAYEAALAPSASVSANFTKLDPSVLDFSSNLPLVIVNSYNRYIGPGGFIPASVRFIGLSGERSTLSGPADFDGQGDVKRRGYTSLRLPKPSMTFKARNGDGDKLKFSPFGLPAESDWVLYAPYQDKTLIRDALAFELSNQMGRYAPRTRFVELFLARGNMPLTARDNLGVY